MDEKQKNSKYIAYSGMIAACSVAVMLIGSHFTAAAYVCAAAASFLIDTIRDQCNLRHALAAYVCVSILSILFVPYKKMVWLFVLLVGYYPLAKKGLDRIRIRVLRLAGKLLLCNATMIFLFWSTVRLLYVGEMMPELGRYAKAAAVLFVIAGNAAFLCYDYALSKALKVFHKTVSPHLGKLIGLR